jgi:hypothetical protein
LSFTSKLDGAVLVKHKVACALSGLPVMDTDHIFCTLAPEVEEKVKAVFKQVEAGLELSDYGNRAYRKSSKPHQDGHNSQPAAERDVPSFEDSLPGIDFQNVPFGGETG